jgi:hypothetical protein
VAAKFIKQRQSGLGKKCRNRIKDNTFRHCAGEKFMNIAIKITLLFSGIYLLVGMLTGILKYRGMMKSEKHEAPIYIDIAHRASLLYSFAALVMAKLLEFSPFPMWIQILSVVIPIIYFSLSIASYIKLGLQNIEITQFSERNFITVWFMYSLIIGEIGGVLLLVGGFVYTQFL